MGKVYDGIDDRLAEFIGRQHVFFVGTAPTDPDGHLNVSPKGLDTFRILGPNSVAYLDLTGSGIETVAHLRENGRITIMFCAFEGRPLIVRLYGRGRVVEPGDAEWDGLIARFPEYPGRPLGGRRGRGAGRRLVRLRRAALRVQGRAVPVDRLRREARGRRAWRSTRPRRTGRASTGSRGCGRSGATGDEPRRPDDPGRGGVGCGLGSSRPGGCSGPTPPSSPGRSPRASASRASRPSSPGCPAGTPRPRGACCWRWWATRPPGAWRCGTSASGTCEMKRLFVAPEIRGRGVGQAAGRGGHPPGRAGGLPADGAGHPARDGRGDRPVPRHGFVETDRYWDNPVGRTIYLERGLGMGD